MTPLSLSLSGVRRLTHSLSDEFLRDSNQLAAHMTGTIKIDGTETFFESFMFGEVDNETGKLEHLIERSVWGAVGKEPEHGVN